MEPPTISAPARRCGARANSGGSISWRVWSPNHERVDLVLLSAAGGRRDVPLRAEPDGRFAVTLPDIPDGQRYLYRLDDDTERPDPCSLWQPDGVHGPSAVVRTERFKWTDVAWVGVPREQLVIYELHVGAFTPEGTFAGVIPRLGALRELGVTAVELMPVGQFPGGRGWGYDGVYPYAAQNSYGGPHGLQRLIDACHAAGLAVLLDVVYNHLGPEGNYVREFGPYFTDRYKTPWGEAVNFDGAGCEPVRDFVLDNARMWLEEFHVDGLRLDAVHAIYDQGPRHILRSIQDVADAATQRRGRPALIVAESDLNDPRLLWPPDRGGYDLDAQWSDDFHHAVHATLTGEGQGYYADFGRTEDVVAVLRRPFLYDGRFSPHRGRRHGASPEGLPGDRFVVCVQNHDRVGNRARGDRLSTLVPAPAQRLAASLLLFSPHIPLLFMGEEYGETNPFPFFCSFGDPALVESVRRGRQEEFAAFAWQGEVPDPQAECTFASARLSWCWTCNASRVGMRRLVGDLLAARRMWPALWNFTDRAARLHPPGVVELVRGGREPAPGGTLRVYFNLTDEPKALPAGPGAGEAVLFASEAACYGGADGSVGGLAPYECVAIGPTAWRQLGV